MRTKIKKFISSLLWALFLVPQIGLLGNMKNVLAATNEVEIRTANAYAEYNSSADLISNINVFVKDSSTQHSLEGVEVELLVDNVSKGILTTEEDGWAHFTYRQVFSSKKSATCKYLLNSSELDDSTIAEMAADNIFSSYEDAYDAAYLEAKTSAEAYLENKVNSAQHSYMVRIKKARAGYLQPNVFSYTGRTEIGPQNLELTMTSTPMKGAIHIKKTGEGLAGYEDNEGKHTVTLYTPTIWQPYLLSHLDETDLMQAFNANNQLEDEAEGEGAVSRFIYEDMPLKDVGFNVYAGEDIISPDGSGAIVFHKGELVGTGYTDEEGELSFYNLTLGKYLIKESETRSGYVLDTKEYTAELTAQSKVAFCEINNKLKEINVAVKNEDYDTGEGLNGAVFGLYANTNIYASNGEQLIAKDRLITTAVTGQSGGGIFDIRLPNESLSDNPELATYYVKEIKAAEGYIDNKDVFFVDKVLSESNQYINYYVVVKDKRKKEPLSDSKDLLPALPIVHDLATSSNTSYQIKGQEIKEVVKESKEVITNPVSLSNNEQDIFTAVNTGDNTVVAWYIWTILMSVSFLTILVLIRQDRQKTNQKNFKN